MFAVVAIEPRVATFVNITMIEHLPEESEHHRFMTWFSGSDEIIVGDDYQVQFDIRNIGSLDLQADSVYADDSDDFQINGFMAWDELICFNSVDADTNAVNVWNGTNKFVASGP